MTSVWADWEDQQVTIEALTGSGGMGDVYAAPVTVQALVDESTRLVRGPDAAEVVSSATVYAPAGTVAPPGSRVTLPGGDQRTVITTAEHHADDPDLAGMEVYLT